nr:hypothetical protein [Methylomarinum sp. Ch1-1]MDP4519843.1 hypothetical protein [Methylomarinum sp. Ch1-1]
MSKQQNVQVVTGTAHKRSAGKSKAKAVSARKEVVSLKMLKKEKLPANKKPVKSTVKTLTTQSSIKETVSQRSVEVGAKQISAEKKAMIHR